MGQKEKKDAISAGKEIVSNAKPLLQLGSSTASVLNSSLPVPQVLSSQAVAVPASSVPGSSLGSRMVSMGPDVLPGVAGLYGAYQLIDNVDNLHSDRAAGLGASAGAGIGQSVAALSNLALPGVGLLIGAGFGALAGKYGKVLWGSSKGKDQMKRDAVRDKLEEVGFLEDKGKYILSDGSVFEMGLDGGFRYDDGMAAYEVNHDDPLQSVVFGHALPLVEMLTGGDDELTAGFTGYFTRAAISNANGDINKALDNVRDMAVKMGVDGDKAKSVLSVKLQEGKIDENNAAAYTTSIDNLFTDERNLDFSALFSDGDKGNWSEETKEDTTRKLVEKTRARKAPERRKKVARATQVVQPMMPVVPEFEQPSAVHQFLGGDDWYESLRGEDRDVPEY